MPLYGVSCSPRLGLTPTHFLGPDSLSGDTPGHRRLSTKPVLKPQEGRADDGNRNVRVEDDPGVTRCEVMSHDHLMHAACGGAEGENRGSNHRSGAITGNIKTPILLSSDLC